MPLIISTYVLIFIPHITSICKISLRVFGNCGEQIGIFGMNFSSSQLLKGHYVKKWSEAAHKPKQKHLQILVQHGEKNFFSRIRGMYFQIRISRQIRLCIQKYFRL
jgi:hypothetical protein